MSKYAIEYTTLTGIADAIREKNGTTDLIPVSDLAIAITNLPSGGGDSGIQIVSGNLPIELSDNSKVLLDYTIYGNSNGVGDRTKNLINWKVYGHTNSMIANLSELKTIIDDGYTIIWSIGYAPTTTGELSYSQSNTYMMVIEVEPNTEYTLYGYTKHNLWEYDADLSPIQSAAGSLRESSVTFTTSGTTKYIIACVYNRAQSATQQPYTLEQIKSFQQLELGESYTGYEPYGYKIIMVSTSGESSIKTTIFINSSLNDGDYINYRSQEAVVGGVKSSCSLPAIKLPGAACSIDASGVNKPGKIDAIFISEINNLPFTSERMKATLQSMAERTCSYFEDFAYDNERYAIIDLSSLDDTDYSISNIGERAFSGFTLPSENVTTRKIRVKMPKNLESISGANWHGAARIQYYDFSGYQGDTPPVYSSTTTTLGNSSAVILVPNSLVDAWKSATGWASFASQIVGVTEEYA